MTVRFYDTEIGEMAQRLDLPSAKCGDRIHGAKKVGDEIVLERMDGEGHTIRWIFFDITKSSFQWRGEVSKDGGKTWKLDEET
jgi:hypothetical protein